MLQRMRSKKGFTLAELLIVVAIIAILVAIAVPLFIGALKDADKKVIEANKRAVRVAAVDKILLDEEGDEEGKSLLHYTDDTTIKTYEGWTVEAFVSASGNISYIYITRHKTAPSTAVTEECEKLTSTTAASKTINTTIKGEEGGYYVKVYVSDLAPVAVDAS